MIGRSYICFLTVGPLDIYFIHQELPSRKKRSRLVYGMLLLRKTGNDTGSDFRKSGVEMTQEGLKLFAMLTTETKERKWSLLLEALQRPLTQ